MLAAIRTTIADLATFPQSGRPLEHDPDTPISVARKPARAWLLLHTYHQEIDIVEVLRVFYGARDWLSAFLEPQPLLDDTNDSTEDPV